MHNSHMKPSILHVISAPIGEYSLLIPSNCILEVTIPDEHQIGQIQKHNKPEVICWNKYNIPLLILNRCTTAIISHLIVIRSLFNSIYQYYALACYSVPKIVEINKNDIKNTITDVNNNIKYQISIKNTTFFIADFNNIESMLGKSYHQVAK